TAAVNAAAAVGEAAAVGAAAAAQGPDAPGGSAPRAPARSAAPTAAARTPASVPRAVAARGLRRAETRDACMPPIFVGAGERVPPPADRRPSFVARPRRLPRGGPPQAE